MLHKISDSTNTTLISTNPPEIVPIQSEEFQTKLSDAIQNYDTTTDPINCPNDLEEIFQQASEKYNISIDLLKAVAKAESDFDPDCTSSSGAMGIMQLMPETAKGLGVTDAYDPYQNIMGGAKYLAENLSIYNGDISLATAAYNAGRGAVKKYNGIPPYTETQNYVKKILNYMNEDISIPRLTVSTENGSVPTNSTLANSIPELTQKEKNAIEELSSKSNTVILSKLY